jgi:hypothetical protein
MLVKRGLIIINFMSLALLIKTHAHAALIGQAPWKFRTANSPLGLAFS